MLLRRLAGPIAGIIIPYIIYVYLKSQPSWDILLTVPHGHFYIVSAVCILAVIMAFAVGIAGRRVRNIKVSFLALAFISLAEIFMVHGLSTPNLIIHQTHVPGVMAPLSVIATTVWLWLSTFPSDHRVVVFFARYERLLLPVWTIIIALLGILVMMKPHWLDFIKLDIYPFNGAVTIVTGIINLHTIYRYFQSYSFSRFPLQIAIVYSAGWIIVAQVIMVTGETWRLSWWIYHFLLLASMLVMLWGLKKQYGANRSLAGVMRALFTRDPYEQITDSISPSVKALMIATESKDHYTAGHNFRVTVYALKIAEQLQLRPDQLRALANGTIIHDIGKLEISDAILNKPGRLTPEERVAIEMHPVRGYEMCRSLGFMKEELEIIRSHHEKWNGEGYPDRLSGEQIPRLARIVAVADVYDALTSDRAYRKAMTHDEAMQLLNSNKGTHFEAACVEAWEIVAKQVPDIYQHVSNMYEQKINVVHVQDGPPTIVS
ncbi:MAG: HD-GYP domain-containing protein [Candidatus Cohnella colombiensis]|uniref:HD-GYP domain-containing protein n=1 Tax=Candidatus Cohnella colombiensis TaxID=3121368 RepID=A0AA95JFC3_9BACL|nr:MAG: HD-GYP domain-containing protein [Cohnella sp.]